MENMKLELKHLAPYLPYGLECIYTDTFGETKRGFLTNINLSIGIYIDGCNDNDAKPILHPLTNFEKFEGIVDEMNEMQMDWLKSHIELGIFPNSLGCISLVSASAFLKMVEYHIDVFSLIPKGLAIDINTLYH